MWAKKQRFVVKKIKTCGSKEKKSKGGHEKDTHIHTHANIHTCICGPKNKDTSSKKKRPAAVKRRNPKAAMRKTLPPRDDEHGRNPYGSSHISACVYMYICM